MREIISLSGGRKTMYEYVCRLKMETYLFEHHLKSTSKQLTLAVAEELRKWREERDMFSNKIYWPWKYIEIAIVQPN